MGDTCEAIFYGTAHARRSGKKILLLRRFRFFGYPKIPIVEIYNLQSPYSLNGPLGKLATFVGNLFITLFFGHITALWNYFLSNGKRLCLYIVTSFLHFVTNGKVQKKQFIKRYYKDLFFEVCIGAELMGNPNYHKNFSWEATKAFDWANEYANIPNFVLPPKKEKRAKEQLTRMGIDSWYVCLHAREGGFHGDMQNARNSNIMNCIPAIKAITEAGGWVVRMGDRSMTPLPQMPRVLDYPFSEFKSQPMDLHLVKNCKFVIAVGGSFVDMGSNLFGKQTVSIGAVELIQTPMPQKNTLVIPKHVFSKKQGRFLSIKELLEEPQMIFESTEKYSLQDNTPEEILDVIIETMSAALGKDLEFSPLQLEFIKKRDESIHSYFEAGLPSNYGVAYFSSVEFDTYHKYRVASRMIGNQGTLGKKYLEQNWHKDQLQKDSSKIYPTTLNGEFN
ncbi:MAG: TIGR04372 family glycosyltransferase [Oligoflexia bacterium]|nr:TIGR04372 family glycosyltransferase [Oligoflexia bacterium]